MVGGGSCTTSARASTADGASATNARMAARLVGAGIGIVGFLRPLLQQRLLDVVVGHDALLDLQRGAVLVGVAEADADLGVGIVVVGVRRLDHQHVVEADQ